MKVRTVLLLSCLLGTGCATVSTTPRPHVAFFPATGHFVRNSVTLDANPICLVVRDYDTFAEVFGAAATGLGEVRNDYVTPEAMTGKIAICVVDAGDHTQKGRDVVRDVAIEHIELQGKTLHVYFRSNVIRTGVTFSANYHSLVLMEACDFSSIALFENGKRNRQIPVRNL